MNKDIQNISEEDLQDYSVYEDEELLSFLEQHDEDSWEHFAIREELDKRGYEASEGFEDEEIESLSPDTLEPKKPKYSVLGTRMWNLLTALFSVAAIIFYAVASKSLGGLREPLVLIFGIAALFISLSYVISGIRLLTNIKEDPQMKKAYCNLEYWVLSILWLLISVFGIYNFGYAFKQSFYHEWIVNLDFGLRLKLAMLSSLPSLIVAFFPFFLGMALLYLALGLRIKKEVVANEDIPF